MEQTSYKVYGYRWVVLFAFMLVVAINQLLWITFAPITSEAARYYGVSDLSIGLLSMCFMIVYIIVSIPASWVIDTYGIRVAVGIGAALTGIFGLLRGLAATEYTWVLIAQIGIATASQPFILNSITKVAARCFPMFVVFDGAPLVRVPLRLLLHNGEVWRLQTGLAQEERHGGAGRPESSR